MGHPLDLVRQAAWVTIGCLLLAACNREMDRPAVAPSAPPSSTARESPAQPEVAPGEVAQTSQSQPAADAAAPAQAQRPPIYDEQADGRAQVAAALEVARRDHKRVLIEFGGNWCGWCYELHDVFHNDAEVAPLVRDEYVLVLVDSNNNLDLLRSYGEGNDRHGFPFLTVLDAEGQVLVNQNTGDLEDGPQHDVAKVKAFLEQWRTPRPPAAAN